MLTTVNQSLPQLPVSGSLPALAGALAAHHAAILHAPPGAGKSTLVPLALLPQPFIGNQTILMLEPRRLATRAIARRMSHLLGEPVGSRVGYRTRLETKVSRGTRIEVITEGILTRMLQDDPALDGIACVIFDEFHERSLNADLGLALTLECQENLRPDLKILVMSATLDTAALARLLKDAPVVASTGGSYEVETRYVGRRADLPLELQMAQVTRAALNEHEGDVLCFLPGAAEIRRVQKNLESLDLGKHVLILPLYGDLPPAAQDAALARAPAGARKIVLATSIAETSLTIDGVRIIVDAGLRRYTHFDPVTGMSRLETGKVSQAAAEQRRGRAGRLASGVCYRLWSQSAQAALVPQTPPEILQADLAPLALELACWGAQDALSLRWLDAPPAAPLAQARELLRELEALDAHGRITEHGRRLARIGAHPRLAHMLARSQELGAPDLACDLAAILSERDILRAAPGARDADIRLRLDVMRGGRRQVPAGLSVDERALAQARQSASNWRRQFKGATADEVDADEMAGVLLALAYPDRIGRSRGEGGRYLLANGRGAVLTDAQALSRAPHIVAAELDDTEREARIFLAAPIAEALLERHFGALIRTQESIEWDARERAVKALRERRLGALILESKPLAQPAPDALIAAVLSGIRGERLDSLPWTRALRQWQARVQLMRAQTMKADGTSQWPDLSDAALLASLEDWAPPWLDGITRAAHFSRIDLEHALHGRLTHAQSVTLTRDVPTHYTVPSGSRIPIDYLDGEVPTLSVRLQEMFGLTRTPATSAGRVPLLLKLLSPAGRPVQITRDLISFWERGYHEVRKDLKGRYPKHYWPEDPHTAVPTRRARPR
ncbi:MAG: ATP-dependent helicase HrpB [Proteobacteria bacterium]|nr:ATP-dependent helicase HrpB [Pseudomonadota bacterium]